MFMELLTSIILSGVMSFGANARQRFLNTFTSGQFYTFPTCHHVKPGR